MADYDLAIIGGGLNGASIARDAAGRGLDLPVIAEGVETADQLAFLSAESCIEVQGYLIGKPLPIGQYAALIGRSGGDVMESVRKTG